MINRTFSFIHAHNRRSSSLSESRHGRLVRLPARAQEPGLHGCREPEHLPREEHGGDVRRVELALGRPAREQRRRQQQRAARVQHGPTAAEEHELGRAPQLVNLPVVQVHERKLQPDEEQRVQVRLAQQHARHHVRAEQVEAVRRDVRVRARALGDAEEEGGRGRREQQNRLEREREHDTVRAHCGVRLPRLCVQVGTQQHALDGPRHRLQHASLRQGLYSTPCGSNFLREHRLPARRARLYYECGRPQMRGPARPVGLLLLTCVLWPPSRVRALAVTDDANLVVPRAAYSSALAAWQLGFPPLAQNAGIVVQACARMRDSYALCAENTLPPMISCAALESELADPQWASIAQAVRGGACALDASEAARPAPLSPAVFVLPGDMLIQSNATLLGAHAFSFHNDTFVFHLRAMLLHEVQGAAVVQQLAWTLTLTIPRLTIGTLTLENECVYRGLLTPPLAVLVARPLADGTRPCIWTCNPSHIRHPYNKPPLDAAVTLNASSPPPYSPLCFPLPLEYVSFVFELTVYVDATGSSFAQSLHDLMDDLAAVITATAQDNGLVDALGVVRIRGAQYDTGSFPYTLQRHNLFSNILASLERYDIAGSAPSTGRRLLQQGSAGTSTAVPVDGMLLTASLQHVDAATAFGYAERTLADLGTAGIHPDLRVQSMTTPRVTTIMRSALTATPRPLDLSLQTQRSIVYAVEGLCILILACRCCVLVRRRRAEQ